MKNASIIEAFFMGKAVAAVLVYGASKWQRDRPAGVRSIARHARNESVPVVYTWRITFISSL
jgi:hypothetical protein